MPVCTPIMYFSEIDTNNWRGKTQHIVEYVMTRDHVKPNINLNHRSYELMFKICLNKVIDTGISLTMNW